MLPSTYVYYVLSSGVIALFLSLAIGFPVVWLCQKCDFRSREIKEGVAGNRSDKVPMGGSFIFLFAITLSLLIWKSLRQVRWGYTICLLIPVWGFAVLGFIDDRSKARGRGVSDRVKILWQITVSLAFAVAFWLYASGLFVPLDETAEWGKLNLPFAGPVALNILYIPFLFVFLIIVSNSVNFTDGFNGLAGGTAVLVTLTYTGLTFASGIQELHTTHQITPIAQRMFALSIMSVAISGSLLGFLFYNQARAAIIMGDTGSMALGAALTFLTVFSQTEFLFLVIAGVFFIEGLSAALQRGWAALLKKVIATSLLDRIEVSRPFIMAPLHHHFEHLALRELESTSPDLNIARKHIRQRITYAAWGLEALFCVIGILAYFVNYNLFWSLGVLLVLGVLGGSIITRFLRDCYFIGTLPASSETHQNVQDEGKTVLTLYRGLPLEWGRHRFYQVYEKTTIPLRDLSFLNQQAVLYRPLYSRVDARLLFGLLYFDRASRSIPAEQSAWYREALNFWEKIPSELLMIKQRHVFLIHMAHCYQTLQQYANAIQTLDKVPKPYHSQMGIIQQIEDIQNEAWQTAEKLNQDSLPLLQSKREDPLCEEEKELLERTLAIHCELCAILDYRRTRNQDFRALLMSDSPRSRIRDPAKARAAETLHLAEIENHLRVLDTEAAKIEQAVRTVRARCERICRRLGPSVSGGKVPPVTCRRARGKWLDQVAPQP